MADIPVSDNREVGVLSKSIHSGKWMLLGTIFQKVLNLGTFFVLARILKPEDYGVMAIIFIVTGVVDRFTSHSFESALIQRRGEVESYLDDIWTINVLKSIAIALLIYLFAHPISTFFHAGQHRLIIGLSGIFILMPNLSSIRQVYLSKELDFKKIFWRDIVGQLSYTITTIVWALFIEASFWALFIGHAVRQFSTMAVTYVIYPIVPILSFKFSKLKGLVNYSKWVYGKISLDYLLSIIDSAYVGKFMNPASLGFYSKASSISSIATAPITNIFTKISFPAYSKLQDNLGKIQEGFLKSFDLLIMAALPASMILIVEGGPIVQLLLGPKWGGIVSPLKILSLASIMFALSRIVFPVFDSLGRPDINFKSNCIQLILSSVFIYFGIKKFGATGAALAMLFVSVFVLAYAVLKARSILRMGKDKFLPSIFSVGFSITMIVILEIPFRVFFRESLGNVSVFIWSIFLGFVYLWAIWWSGKWLKSGPRHTLMVVFRELKKRDSK